MNILIRIFAVAMLALALPACAAPKKQSSCCSMSGKCPPNDPSCHAPAAKKKAN